jgi:integrase
MAKKITETWLRAKTDARETRSEPGGLVARKGPQGAAFYAQYTLDGRLRWVHLGAHKRDHAENDGLTLAQARAAAAARRVQVSEARHGRALDPAAERRAEKAAARVERLADPTTADFAALYIRRHAKPNKKTWAEDERILRADVLPLIGGLRFAALERKHYIAVLDRKVDAGFPKQAGEVLKVLRKMENLAVERGQIAESRIVGIKAPAKSPPRRRVLVSQESSEIGGLFRALEGCGMHPGMKLAIEFQLLTAQRPGAVNGALWDEVKSGVWTVPAERMKRMRSSPWADLPNVVPLSEQALAVLEKARALSGDSEFVFPGRDAGKPWSDTAIDHEIHREQTLAKFREHGIERFNLHDLRRTATTIMARLGIAPHVLDRVLGHVPRGVTAEHYDLYEYSAEKRAALVALGASVARLKAGEPAEVVFGTAKVVPFTRRPENVSAL